MWCGFRSYYANLWKMDDKSYLSIRLFRKESQGFPFNREFCQ